jgi:hypothetical protein
VTTLSQQDADRVVQCVASLASPLTLEGLRQEAVRVVHGLVPSMSTTWNEISSTGGIEVVGVPKVEPWPGGEEVFARLIVDHPVIAQIRRTNDGRPRAISDVWSVEKFHRSALYREFYSHLGAEDQLSFTVPSPPHPHWHRLESSEARLLREGSDGGQPDATALAAGLSKRDRQRANSLPP